MQPDAAERLRCYRCFKPRVTCVCARIPFVRNETGVTILQHPRERFHALGSVRFAELGLENVEVRTAYPGFHSADSPPGAALLYPCTAARALGDLPADQRPRHLIVLDGTWHHVRAIYKKTPWLHDLPHVELRPAEPSRYRIRREPGPSCLSTIEAIVLALGILEPHTPRLDGLLSAFDSMIDQQIGLLAEHRTTPRVFHKRPLRSRKLPRALVEDFHRLVVVYGESALRRHEHQHGARQLLQFAAVRVATGETLDHVVRPTAALLKPWHLSHMRLRAEDFLGGARLKDVKRSWEAFVRSDDILAAYSIGTLNLCRIVTGKRRSVVLKAAHRNVEDSGGGPLESIVDRLLFAREPRCLRGRAKERIENAIALATYLHERSR